VADFPVPIVICTEFVPLCALLVVTATVFVGSPLSTVQFESSVVLPSNPSQKIAAAGQPGVPPSPEPLTELPEAVLAAVLLDTLDPVCALVVAIELLVSGVLAIVLLVDVDTVAGVLVVELDGVVPPVPDVELSVD
jgi:hypothetical protein